MESGGEVGRGARGGGGRLRGGGEGGQGRGYWGREFIKESIFQGDLKGYLVSLEAEVAKVVPFSRKGEIGDVFKVFIAKLRGVKCELTPF